MLLEKMIKLKVSLYLITIGNRINDVYVLGTPKMIILGNKFDGENYSVEDIKDNSTDTVKVSEIVDYFKNL